MSDWNRDRLLGLARQFSESRILLTAAELDLFTLLATQPRTSAEIADQLGGADLRALNTLMDALAAMGLLVKKDDRYICDPTAAPVLSADSPESVLPMVLHAGGMWRSWSRLTDIVRGPDAPPPDASAHELARQRAFIGAMHVIGAPMADRIVADVNPGGAARLIDIGGGSGTYTIAFLRAVPGMSATLFDLPPVIAMARERLEAAGMLDRVTLAPGDFNADPLPPGHDLALLSAIIHMNSREENVALYRKVHEALVPGGRVVIRDHVMAPDRTTPRPGALFAINMLVATPGGGTYTLDEIREDLEKAGFERVKQLQTDDFMNGLVEAFRPA